MEASSVFAYLDPGTGSYVFQLLMATAFGALLALKLFWHHTRFFLGGRLGRGKRP